MAEDTEGQGDIKDTDIVFDCPDCGKSLAIDYHGAGLTIVCTDCGNKCVVPIPEGMQIDDIDSSEEDQEIRILNLRRSLAAAEARVLHLEAEVQELTARRKTLEEYRTGNVERFASVSAKVAVIATALDTISEAIGRITEALAPETPGPGSPSSSRNEGS